MAKQIQTVTPTEGVATTVEELTPEQMAELEASLAPFDYDFLEPLVKQAARLLGVYEAALVEAKLSTEVRQNLIYDFHRKLWGINLAEESE